jgi:hypothetical protein
MLTESLILPSWQSPHMIVLLFLIASLLPPLLFRPLPGRSDVLIIQYALSDTSFKVSLTCMLTFAKLAKMFNEIVDLIIGEYATPWGHQGGFINGQTAFLDHLEQFGVATATHRFGIGMVTRLYRHILNIRPHAIALHTMALHAVCSVIISRRFSLRDGGKQEQ